MDIIMTITDSDTPVTATNIPVDPLCPEDLNDRWRDMKNGNDMLLFL